MSDSLNTPAILRVLFCNLKKNAKEEAVNSLFGLYWNDFFGSTGLRGTSFIKYKRNILYLSLENTCRKEFIKNIKEHEKYIKNILGDDFRRIEYGGQNG